MPKVTRGDRAEPGLRPQFWVEVFLLQLRRLLWTPGQV